MVQLAGHIAQHLKARNIDVVLVGGLAVACYTDNRYLTKDIDMVDISYQTPSALQSAMKALGFQKKGRVYTSDKTDIVVEFPSAPLSVGDEFITKHTEFKTEQGAVPILLAHDVVKDRLAAYFHWQDKQSLVQALCIMLCHSINPNEIRVFCIKESSKEAFLKVASYHDRLKNDGVLEMVDIERFVITNLKT
ncbi:hypothetical protein QWY82_08090 [Simiduia curdlanivorans]|uniref:Uncharacterized protein n=1 Tax=Simiduia curdlanivorans TaxID=1492769 RepID=A0ABV8V679_9GAMM|nr:hypothetical protein [Simiduia curdlanivorans]MDN3638764.1 hypothetical protein [Simiduia curdlanivorans]